MTDFRRAQFTLQEGDVVVEFVEPLSPESIADLEQYFALLINRLKRDASDGETEE